MKVDVLAFFFDIENLSQTRAEKSVKKVLDRITVRLYTNCIG